jgi:tripartite-type tricarboxylate transporter receptor subunit TctC
MNRALFAATLALVIAAASAHAAWPDRPIRLIVPYPPGGNIDITARTVAPGLGEALGVQVVIDNRGGAGGTIGSEIAAKSAPDGYTTLLGSTGTLATSQALYPKLGFHPLRDFAYTSLVSRVALVVAANPSLPARTVNEFIALAKSKPGRVTMGSAGVGTSNHLTGEYFQTVTRSKLTHVPYKGSGPALVDLMGGQIDMMFDQVSSSVGYIQAGKIRALAVTTLKRSIALPNVPTMDESGFRGFEASTSTGILLPAGTPREIVSRVHAALVKVLRQSSTRDAFARLGADVIESTPEEFDKLMLQENAKWTKVIRDGRVTIE